MSKENETIDVATYGRNSSDKQIHSQEIQTDAFTIFGTGGFVRLFGKPAHIVENYRDDGKSASSTKKKSKRHDFNRMLSDIQAGKVKIVLMLNTSRFSRLLARLEFFETGLAWGSRIR